MSKPSRRALSVRTRLVILVSTLLLAVIVPLSVVTFLEVQSTLITSGGARAQEAANNLAELFGQSARQRFLEVRRVAALPAIREFLLKPTPASERAARDAMRALVSPQPPSLVELWDAHGRRLMAIAMPESADAMLATGAAPSPGTSALRRMGDRTAATVTSTVSRDPSRGDAAPSDVAGYLASHRLSTIIGNADTVRRLVGANASFGLGNRSGDIWSDLTRFMPPPVRTNQSGITERTRVDGTPMVAAVSLIPDTPYSVSVEFPRAAVVAPAAAFVRRIAFGGGIVLLIGVGLTLFVTRRISTPIAAVTEAAERIAAGDYSHRVSVGRLDEVGRLAVAFNRMTAQVQADQESQARAIRLEEENRRAQEATRLKSEFLANMSHELRTPLNSIIGFAELLYDGQVPPGSPEHKEFLNDILTSGRHLLQLINDVLDLAKVESGRFAFHPEPVDLTRTVGEVLNLLRTSAANKQLHIDAHVDPSIGEVTIDPGRFKQVLYNYLSNAIKFTPNGGSVFTRVIARDADTFTLEVEDTGIGIAAGDLSRLFVEFQQLEPGAAKKHQGTGLGLALTKRLVEAQGGSVGVRSEPGTGSVFTATLPRVVNIGDAQEPSRSFAGAAIDAKRVLVIEDNTDDRNAIVSVLQLAGYAVDTAGNAAQGRERLETQSYDAITLDLLLPDANGIDLLREIRACERHGSVPVVVITVVAPNGAVAAYGVDDVLTKPVENNELLHALRRAMGSDARGRVLVVDDTPGSLRLMAASLAQLGYDSVCVTKGEDGLRIAAEATPAAVILDLVMPEMNGFEFLSRFRELAHCAHTPVIIWTVQDLKPAERELLRTSAQGILSKGHDATRSVVAELGRLLPPAVSA